MTCSSQAFLSKTNFESNAQQTNKTNNNYIHKPLPISYLFSVTFDKNGKAKQSYYLTCIIYPDKSAMAQHSMKYMWHEFLLDRMWHGL